jgi:hypothetical protein
VPPAHSSPIQTFYLGHLSPVDALKSWREKKPELILKRVYKQAELDKPQALGEP